MLVALQICVFLIGAAAAGLVPVIAIVAFRLTLRTGRFPHPGQDSASKTGSAKKHRESGKMDQKSADKSRYRQDIYFRISAFFISLEIFLCFFHWQILIPTNVNWLLQGDWGAHVLGWNAFRYDAWRWPLGSTNLLAWPHGVTVTYTDSNPLLCLLLKPFSAILPTPFQFTGLWLLSCILLQFAVALTLLRPHVKDQFLRLIGAILLTVVPTLVDRMVHVNLCAHWTILLSLHLFINVEDERRRDIGYAAILLISALIHPYLLFMNASIWGSDALRRSARLLRERALMKLGVLAVRAAAVALAPLAALLATGALSGFRVEAGGFGYYSMALDALFNPGTPNYSQLLPVAPQGEGQLFEGFQYLGAGLLAVILAALATLAWPQGRARLWRLRQLAWLTPALLVLLTLALSDQVQFHGRVVAHLPLDWLPLHLTSVFRASGRLFWPCTYVLLFVSLILVLSLPRPAAYALGLGALALQAVDLSRFTSAERATTAEAAAPARYAWARSREWDRLIGAADVVEFQPPDPHANDRAFYEIVWRASSLKRPVNVMYTARTKPVQAAFEAASRNRFISGQLDPQRLYVLLSGCAPPAIDGARLRQLDHILVIPPAGFGDSRGLGPAPPAPAFPFGRTVGLYTTPQDFRCMLGKNWGMPQGRGVRSDGTAPDLLLRLVTKPQRDMLLTMNARAISAENEKLSIIVSGRTIADVSLSREASALSVRVPSGFVLGPLLQIGLHLDPLDPASAGARRSDARPHGIELRSVRLDWVR